MAVGATETSVEADGPQQTVPLASRALLHYSELVTRNEIIRRLQAHKTELNRQGVLHAALFGSVARGEAGPASDIDIMIELDESAVPDIFAYAGIKRSIAELFDGPVDVVDRAALKPWVRDRSTADAIYAF